MRIACFLVVGLVAGLGNVASAQTSSYPKAFFDFRFSSIMAHHISEECGSFFFSRSRYNEDWNKLVKQTRESGSIGKLKHNLDRVPDELFQPAAAEFYARHKIYSDSDSSVYCAAGDAEKSARSKIGRYLNK